MNNAHHLAFNTVTLSQLTFCRSLVSTADLSLYTVHTLATMFSRAAIALLAAASAVTALPDGYPTNQPNKAGQACSQLKAAYPNNLIDPTSPNYATERDVNWSTTCDLPAACFFVPTSTEMVARGLSIVTRAGSQFAVRNGGHNPNIKFASVDGNGVLFDMSQMDTLTLNSDNTILHAGTGHKGGDVQQIADSVGKSVVTGLNTNVGISGLTLGGGYTHFSQQNGLVTDNIVNFEVVLGNSSVVNANATHNADLYRALRGGGNNFGIVTRFDMQVSAIHNIWYTSFTLNATDYEKFMPALAQVQANMETDLKANVYFGASPRAASVALMYAEPAGRPAAFAPLLDLKPLGVRIPPTNGTVYSLAQAMSPPDETGAGVMTSSVIHKATAEYYTALYREVIRQGVPTGNETDIALAIKPMGSRVNSVGTAQAGGVPNSINVPTVSHTWTSVAVRWQDERDRAQMSRRMNEMTSWLSTNARRSGLALPNLFANDANSDQNVMASYGSESLANLKAVSRKYDPAQVFQRLQAGGWFVSRA